MFPESLGITAALPTRASRRPLRKGNPSPTPTNKSKWKLAFVIAVAAFQEAPSAPTIWGSQVKQAESKVVLGGSFGVRYSDS